jgi:hypothetical protein
MALNPINAVPIIKASSDFENNFAQWIHPNDIRFTEEIEKQDKLTFTLPIKDTQILSLKEFSKITLEITDGITDDLIWSGFVRSISNDLKEWTIECSDGKWYMSKKIIFETKGYSSEPISNILEELTSEANTREGSTLLNYNTDSSDVVTKGFPVGTNYLTILNEICESLDLEWYMSKGVIIVGTIGGSSEVELINDIDNPAINNINIKQERNADTLYNNVFVKSKINSSSDFDAASISNFGSIEKKELINEGSLLAAAENIIANSKDSQRTIDINIADSTIDFRDVKLGDWLQLTINQNNALIDVNESVRVIQRTVQWNNTIPILSLKVSSTTTKIDSPANKLANISNQIQNLQNNI